MANRPFLFTSVVPKKGNTPSPPDCIVNWRDGYKLFRAERKTSAQGVLPCVRMELSTNRWYNEGIRLRSTSFSSIVVRIMLRFKDQRSADSVRGQLRNLGKTIGRSIQPVYTSRKIATDFLATETKPSLVNQQCVGCLLFQMWSVLRKLCRLHMPRLTPTHWGAHASRRLWESIWATAW